MAHFCWAEIWSRLFWALTGGLCVFSKNCKYSYLHGPKVRIETYGGGWPGRTERNGVEMHGGWMLDAWCPIENGDRTCMVGMIGEIPATIISSRAACMHSHNQGHNQLIIAAALQVPLVILTARVRYPYDDRHTHICDMCVPTSNILHDETSNDFVLASKKREPCCVN
jgi:hypothetical protein